MGLLKITCCIDFENPTCYSKAEAQKYEPCKTNVRPAFFYTKHFVYNPVAICLIMIKLLHHTVEGPSIYCGKF